MWILYIERILHHNESKKKHMLIAIKADINYWQDNLYANQVALITCNHNIVFKQKVSLIRDE